MTFLELPGRCDINVQYTILQDIEAPIADAGEEISNEIFTCDELVEINGFLDGSASSSGPDFNYLWTTTDGLILSGETSAVCEYGASGTYTLLVNDISNGCTSSAQTVVNINIIDIELILESVEIQNTQATQATGSIMPVISGGNMPYEYLWSNGAQTSFIDNLLAGTYTLTVTDANGCLIEQSFIVETEEPNSTKDQNGEYDIVIFPNPTSGLLQLETDYSIGQLILYDLAGQEIWSIDTTIEKQFTLDFSFLAAGCYMLKYEVQGNFGVKRIIVF